MEERLNNRQINVKNILLKYNAVLILIALIIASTILSDAFFTVTNIFNLLRQLVPMTLATLGMLLVVLTGGIDLSVGSVTAMGGMITAIMIQNAGMVSGASMIVILIAVLGIGFLIGCMSGAFVVVLKMAPFVATLATMTIIRGAAYMTSNGQPIRLSSEYDTSAMMVKFGSQGIPGIGLPWPVVLIIAVIVLMWLVMRNTVFGRLVIAFGSNETAVRLAGINVNKYKFFAYAICGMLCALGGFILTSRVAVASPAVSTGMELDAIAACVIGGASLMGGKGSVGNTIIGVLVLGLITNVMTLLSIAAYPQQIIKGLIIVLAVFLQYITNKEGAY